MAHRYISSEDWRSDPVYRGAVADPRFYINRQTPEISGSFEEEAWEFTLAFRGPLSEARTLRAVESVLAESGCVMGSFWEFPWDQPEFPFWVWVRTEREPTAVISDLHAMNVAACRAWKVDSAHEDPPERVMRYNHFARHGDVGGDARFHVHMRAAHSILELAERHDPDSTYLPRILSLEEGQPFLAVERVLMNYLGNQTDCPETLRHAVTAYINAELSTNAYDADRLKEHLHRLRIHDWVDWDSVPEPRAPDADVYRGSCMLRCVTARHLDAHRALRLEMLAGDPDEFWQTTAHAEAMTDAEWLEEINERLFIQALDFSGTVIGQIGLLDQPYTPKHHLADDDVHVIGMYVSPSARGRGIADVLMQEAEIRAYAMGRPNLVLDVASNATGAIRFYERYGFTATGDCEPHPRRPDVRWLTYRYDYEGDRDSACDGLPID